MRINPNQSEKNVQSRLLKIARNIIRLNPIQSQNPIRMNPNEPQINFQFELIRINLNIFFGLVQINSHWLNYRYRNDSE